MVYDRFFFLQTFVLMLNYEFLQSFGFFVGNKSFYNPKKKRPIVLYYSFIVYYYFVLRAFVYIYVRINIICCFFFFFLLDKFLIQTNVFLAVIKFIQCFFFFFFIRSLRHCWLIGFRHYTT